MMVVRTAAFRRTRSCNGGWKSSHVIHRLSASPVARRRLSLVAGGWERRRFYKKVSVYKTEEGFGVQLDHRRLRTPLRELLLLPAEPLALAVAQEWAAQGPAIQPSFMHLTALCNTVLDSPGQRSDVVDSLLQYLETDTILFRVTAPDDLVEMQNKEWDPVLNWFNDRFTTRLQPCTTLQPPTLPSPSISSISHFLSRLNPWTLEGFRYAVVSCQSLVLTSALLEGQVDVESATNFSRLETRHQTQCWGSVEWHHEVEHEDLRSRLSAALLLAELAGPDPELTRKLA